MSSISRARALELAREYFDVKDEQLDELLCAVLRIGLWEVEYPLPAWRASESELRTKLASTRALFAETFRVSAAPRQARATEG